MLSELVLFCCCSGKYSYCRPEKSKFDEAFPLEA
jgi:hypothetical protein